ncbi:MAG: hypothetical protein K0B09_13010 [Bacteroidales bacterium]|nr:hypothetical protein [Bacteroidales bacterium]
MRIVFSIILLFQAFALLAQRPTHIPTNNEPVGFFDSVANVILFIVLPIAVVVFYYLWRRWLRKQQEENESRE